jgi:hypothetical protein
MRHLISSGKGFLFHWPLLAGILCLLSDCILFLYLPYRKGLDAFVYPYFSFGEVLLYVCLLLSSSFFLFEGIKQGEQSQWAAWHRGGFHAFFVLSVLFYGTISMVGVAWGNQVVSCKLSPSTQTCGVTPKGSIRVQQTIYHVSSHIHEDTGYYIEAFDLYRCESSALWCHDEGEIGEIINGDQSTSISTVALKVSHDILSVSVHNSFHATYFTCNVSMLVPSCTQTRSGYRTLEDG